MHTAEEHRRRSQEGQSRMRHRLYHDLTGGGSRVPSTFGLLLPYQNSGFPLNLQLGNCPGLG